jgi:hypothetical protein
VAIVTIEATTAWILWVFETGPGCWWAYFFRNGLQQTPVIGCCGVAALICHSS